MKKTVYDLLSEADKIVSEKDRAEFLRKNSSTQLKTLLDYGFNRVLKFDLPTGVPPFKKLEPADGTEGRLLYESKLLYRFLAPPRGLPELKKNKKEKLFLDVLESIHPDDAILLCHIKDKSIPSLFKNVHRRVVNKAFPTLIKEETTNG